MKHHLMLVAEHHGTGTSMLAWSARVWAVGGIVRHPLSTQSGRSQLGVLSNQISSCSDDIPRNAWPVAQSWNYLALFVPHRPVTTAATDRLRF